MAQFTKFSSVRESGQLIVMRRPGEEEDCSQDDYLPCIHSLRFVRIKDLWRESGDVDDRTDDTHLLQLFLLLRVKTYQLLWSDLSAMAYSPHAYLSYPSLYHQWPKMPCGGEDHSKQYPGAVAHQCHLCSKGLP